LVWALILAASVASAQTNEETLPRMEIPPDDSQPLNRFGLSYRAGFNITASFKNKGPSSASDPGPAMGGVDHNYDDGFNRVDISGNAGGMTWNWGYASASQIVGDTLAFSSSRAGTINRDVAADPSSGLELTYNRQLGTCDNWRWGLEAAWNYSALSLRDKSVAGNGPLTVDTYRLGGIVPPLPPYAGTFAGPGPLIGDTPTRLPVTFVSKLDADVFGWRLGPYVDIPLSDRLTFSLSGGLAVLLVDSELDFHESVTVGSSKISKSVSGSHADVLPGGYLSGAFSVAVTESLRVFTGAQYQGAGHYVHREGNKQATLDFGQSVFCMVGAAFSF
jgi:hypothetical protein